MLRPLTIWLACRVSVHRVDMLVFGIVKPPPDISGGGFTFLFCVSFAQMFLVLTPYHLGGAPRGLWGASSVSSNISERHRF